jgi:formamidopyrimidine-DNA glycosylase
MPELAEVEFFRRRWQQAAAGKTVRMVLLHERARIFRGTAPAEIVHRLAGARFEGSSAAAKQMLFRFRDGCWLGIHLGMSGELRAEPADYSPRKHDHLVLVTSGPQLVFSDPRMFGRVQFHVGTKAPAWWTEIAPAILSPKFTVSAVADFLRRRARAPIKAVLLMQERFPGVGNWMADEILWRAAIHPRRAAGSLTIAGRGRKLPPDLNVHIPDSWLFNHRWQPGGRCPRTGQPLAHATIGGRTTCWSPARQKLP